MMLKVIYAFFVGILLSIFVAVGISTFYPEPEAPQASSFYQRSQADPNSVEFKQQEAAYTAELNKHNEQLAAYNRNVSIIALVAAIVFVGIGLVFASRIQVVSDGLLLGGVFTLIYSIARGFMNDENSFRFVIVTAGLVIALVLGYFKFIKSGSKKAARKK